MRIFDQSEQSIPEHNRGVALGFFDGVHRGHADLIRTLVVNCEQLDLIPAVYTFDQHPGTVLQDDKGFGGYITTWSDRVEQLGKLGVEEVHCQHFDDEFSRMKPEDFLQQIIGVKLSTKLVVAGADYRFGYKGAGDTELLEKWCKSKGIKLIIVPDVNLYDQRVSSSRIRKLLKEGNMKHAASCLGRPFSLKGEVVKGRRIGRAMGFPTANFVLDPDLLCPEYGVYVTRTRVGDRTYWSITNFGLRPTVNDKDKSPTVETYLYDTKQDLYGQTIEVFFLEKLRPEEKFGSLLQLGTQIKEDLEQAYAWHQDCEDSYVSATVNKIPVWFLQTRRFAQASMQIVFQQRINREKAACYALLMQVLTASCKKYPTRVSLSTELDRLYGSTIDSHVEKQGDLQSVYLTVDGLIGWSDGSKPFKQAVQILFDILLEPDLDEDGNFSKTIFESEKQNLIMEAIARENDKARYSYDRSLELFCGDQPHGIKAGGNLEDLKNVSLEDLKDVYNDLLNKTSVMVCVGGKISSGLQELIYNNLERLPYSEDRCEFGSIKPASVKIPEGEICKDEYKKIEQARVNLIITGLPYYFSHQGIIVSLLNSMLGGDVHSLLFDTVREKMGLAYSVYSAYSRYLSALFILSGIEPSQTDAAIAAIEDQIAVIARGDFDDRLFETSKRLLTASIESSHDDLGQMLSSVVSAVILGRTLSTEDALSLLNAVKKEQVVNMAQKLEVSVRYRLLPESRKEVNS